MKTPRIVVVGSANTDMVVKSRRIARAGRNGHRRAVRHGGRRQGGQPGRGRRPARGRGHASWPRSGSDMFGDQAIDELPAEGIVTDCILRDPEARHRRGLDPGRRRRART